jgi:Uma2 family endonuclease
MLQFDLPNLPSTAELPCSDDPPVDNEDQNLLPNILLFLLKTIWAEPMDWYFGVDMAVYHTEKSLSHRRRAGQSCTTTR